MISDGDKHKAIGMSCWNQFATKRTHLSTDSVAVHGIAKFLPNRNERSIYVGIANPNVNPTPTKNLTMLSNVPNLASNAQVGSSHNMKLVRQALAALFAPAIQDLATSRRTHTSAKTMFVFALAVVWLKCAFHQNTSYLQNLQLAVFMRDFGI